MMANHDPLMANQTSGEAIIMAVLSTSPSPALLSHQLHLRPLPPPPLLPNLFLPHPRHLHSLSLHHMMSLLIASHLLYNHTTLLKNSMQGAAAVPTLYSSVSNALLLLLCELHQQDGQELLETPPSQLWILLCKHVSCNTLNLSGFGRFSTFEVLNEYIEMVAKCSNFVNVMGCGGELGKSGTGGAAAVATVVALPSVEVITGGECVIRKEETKEGREMCELPCGHYFRWMLAVRMIGFLRISLGLLAAAVMAAAFAHDRLVRTSYSILTT